MNTRTTTTTDTNHYDATESVTHSFPLLLARLADYDTGKSLFMSLITSQNQF